MRNGRSDGVAAAPRQSIPRRPTPRGPVCLGHFHPDSEAATRALNSGFRGIRRYSRALQHRRWMPVRANTQPALYTLYKFDAAVLNEFNGVTASLDAEVPGCRWYGGLVGWLSVASIERWEDRAWVIDAYRRLTLRFWAADGRMVDCLLMLGFAHTPILRLPPHIWERTETSFEFANLASESRMVV